MTDNSLAAPITWKSLSTVIGIVITVATVGVTVSQMFNGLTLRVHNLEAIAPLRDDQTKALAVEIKGLRNEISALRVELAVVNTKLERSQ